MSEYIHGGHIRARLVSHKIRRSRYAPSHLGLVRWSMVVVNTKTGETFASDNGWASHSDALNDAGRVVAAARMAWNYGFGKKVVN